MQKGFWGHVLDLLFPPRCIFCGKVLPTGQRDICQDCQARLPWMEEGEAEQSGEFFSLCASPLRYQEVVRDSLHRYKFKGQQGYAKAYGRLVAQCVQDHLAGRYDLITWVPLSHRRLKERGYDQARLLAEDGNTVWTGGLTRWGAEPDAWEWAVRAPVVILIMAGRRKQAA